MTNHPAIQPRLTRSNVETILNQLAVLDETYQVDLADTAAHENRTTSDYWRGFRDAMTSSRELVMMMWESAVIAARATEQQLADDEAAQGHAQDSDLDKLSDIASELLKLADRLDEME